ncbi:MAG: hypothetical protein JSV16_14820 [Candidatus Hydrogenedentota bacterium]|nr:MAG: hypothetical protein JSV16_14820 [Candidatus Hydrogenedentota bacterium]
MMRTVFLKSLNFTVNPESVLKRMGVRTRQEEWLGIVSRICDEYLSHIRPRGIYREALCLPNGRTIDIGESLSLESSFLRNHLPKSKKAAIFLVTIGPELEESIRKEIDNGRTRKAYILDCLGSNAAESAAAVTHRVVQEKFKLSMRRYSPGYNDWDISQQEILFEFLGRENAREVGVGLTPDFMMAPRKSVSGIILPRTESKQHGPT